MLRVEEVCLHCSNERACSLPIQPKRPPPQRSHFLQLSEKQWIQWVALDSIHICQQLFHDINAIGECGSLQRSQTRQAFSP